MIHTITTVQKIIFNKDNGYDFGDIKCIGYFLSPIAAITEVETNFKDIHANMYQYCIIERMPEGILKEAKDRIVYEWQNGQYKQIDEPQLFTKLTNFGLR